MARPATISREDVGAAASAVLDAGGAESVTMRAVGDRLGVSAMALYRHVEGRDALLGLVADRGFDELAVDFRAAASSVVDPVEGLIAVLDRFVALALARRHLFRLMFTDERPGARDLTRQAAASPTLTVVIDLLRRAVSFEDEALLAEIAVGGAALVQGLCLSRITGRIGGDDAAFRGLVERCVRRYLIAPAAPHPAPRTSHRAPAR